MNAPGRPLKQVKNQMNQLTFYEKKYIYYRCLHAPLAQLDRVTDYESVGQVFESPRARQKIQALSSLLS